MIIQGRGKGGIRVNPTCILFSVLLDIVIGKAMWQDEPSQFDQPVEARATIYT